MMEKIKVHFGSGDEYLNCYNGETRERLEIICSNKADEEASNFQTPDPYRWN